MDIFPMVQPNTEEAETDPEYPLYRDVKWDLRENKPIFKNGAPVIIEGQEAVLGWVLRALCTERDRYEIYSEEYGCEIEILIGQPYTKELKEAEAARYLEECLICNPYITGVTDVAASFEDGRMELSCRISTIYGNGEVSINV